MRIALTGTPGVGKTTSASLIKTIKVVSVDAFAKESGAVVDRDSIRDTNEVDIDVLAEAANAIDEDVLFEGHLSHLLSVDIAIVLRCSPRVLRDRLIGKGWTESKVRENVEAEAVDVILIEALDAVPKVCEIDTTLLSVEEVARAVEEIGRGESEKYQVGHVDWSQEVLDWF
ncbi:MAG: adenylate kinase family protein [Methanobacteriota archaeon]|nr:MAG: adenylate kinase family protein [Euryarchaeota archaeon]